MVLHIVVILLIIMISSNINRHPILHKIVYECDTMSISQIKISRACFKKLCHMLETFGGLKRSGNMDIDEQVAMFLHILAHNVKNCVIIRHFYSSRKRLVDILVEFIMQLYDCKPELVPNNSTDQRLKWFKNCFGALDGTYIKCPVLIEEKAISRTRKNDIAKNILALFRRYAIYLRVTWMGGVGCGW
uniref:DUF8040 domain-containing protein n=1 Tax=Lactuca sativa TaxID=4236 RepID=A0A9R1XX24_LACSA|nr:hypothetical protein LSAT_V11C200064080 [Lactuca sativa]